MIIRKLIKGLMLLIACIHRLGHLPGLQVRQGLPIPPHIITEIESYQPNIATFKAELAEITTSA